MFARRIHYLVPTLPRGESWGTKELTQTDRQRDLAKARAAMKRARRAFRYQFVDCLPLVGEVTPMSLLGGVSP